MPAPFNLWQPAFNFKASIQWQIYSRPVFYPDEADDRIRMYASGKKRNTVGSGYTILTCVISNVWISQLTEKLRLLRSLGADVELISNSFVANHESGTEGHECALQRKTAAHPEAARGGQASALLKNSDPVPDEGYDCFESPLSTAGYLRNDPRRPLLRCKIQLFLPRNSDFRAPPDAEKRIDKIDSSLMHCIIR